MVLAQWLTSEAMGHVFRPVARGLEPSVTFDLGSRLHLIGGLVILALLLARLWLRMRRGVPPPPLEMNASLTRLAKVAHWGFYVVLALLVLSGLAALVISTAAGGPHGFLFNLLLALLALHVAAVGYHTLVLRDGLLRRMLVPERSGG